MSDTLLQDTLTDLRIQEYIDQSAEATLARSVASHPNDNTRQRQPERLPRLAFVYESQGLAAAILRAPSGETADQTKVKDSFQNAFVCWCALCSLSEDALNAIQPSAVSEAGLALLDEELADDPISAYLTLAFRLAVSGVMAERSAETRLELRRFVFMPNQGADWRVTVSEHVFSAFVLLVRKDDGWRDIGQALTFINELRRLQRDFETQYLDANGGPESQAFAAAELVGLYHLAQIITVTGEYLRDGRDSIAQVNLRLDRHRERSRSAFQAAFRPVYVHLADLLWCGCRELALNSIWTHIVGLGVQTQEFAKLLASLGRPNPVIELWPSQQEALRRNLLDPYRRAVLVEMPTSAGKTLLAKFSIIQTKALNPTGTIAYVVPTRALVNQVTLDLRADFRALSTPLQVEQTVPAFELDPTEGRLLGNAPDVLVTTPEKLDLLVRRGHASTLQIALVIADEAHNLREGSRGARLELLLGMIKRDRPSARFLLLSPFLPNDEELVGWLGDNRALPPISVNWRPGRRIVGTVQAAGRGANRHLCFQSLPAAANTDLRSGIEIPIGDGLKSGESQTLGNLSKATVESLSARGSILVLCRGQGTAMTRAGEIAADRTELPRSANREAVCHYLAAEVGRASHLIGYIRKGVAYHHAGLSHETRWLIEGLIREKQVDVICGTTTLAQGMNFPITTVIVETLKKGVEDLTYQDFWNIAGRAGRTLVDSVGVVVFPAPTAEKRREYVEFLRGEAQQISSQLTALLVRADELAGHFDLETLRNWPELSTLLQFLAHAMRVSDSKNLADEVEDILRASLVYHQAQRVSEESTRGIVRLCRTYLQQVRGQPGLLVLADQTGFATPSVLSLLDQTRNNQEFRSPENWRAERLFGEDIRPLQQRIQAVAHLPEMQLGQSTGGTFDSERVALILRDWVRGDSLTSLADKYLIEQESDPDKKVAAFSRYLFSELLGRASWGLGALEGVSFAGQDVPVDGYDVNYVPSMVFFGVRRKEAVWLRMAGVPRIVADGLGRLWQTTLGTDPNTYDEIRQWVSNLSDADWRQTIPVDADITPQDMRVLWRQFAG